MGLVLIKERRILFSEFALSKSQYLYNKFISQLKLGNIRVIFSNFHSCACWEKYMNDNKHNNLHWAGKCARICVSLDIIILFLKAHSFPQATLLKNGLLLRTDKYIVINIELDD